MYLLSMPALIAPRSTREQPLTTSRFDDPATLTYPVTLPMEIALKVAPIKTICEAYGIDREQWDQIRVHPMFINDVRAAIEVLKTEGMSFLVKARLQAEELLTTNWQMIHDKSVPASVRADLSKFTIRVAGYDKTGENGAGSGPALSITFNF